MKTPSLTSASSGTIPTFQKSITKKPPFQSLTLFPTQLQKKPILSLLALPPITSKKRNWNHLLKKITRGSHPMTTRPIHIISSQATQNGIVTSNNRKWSHQLEFARNPRNQTTNPSSSLWRPGKTLSASRILNVSPMQEPHLDFIAGNDLSRMKDFSLLRATELNLKVSNHLFRMN
jgi:hypothetical protein